MAKQKELALKLQKLVADAGTLRTELETLAETDEARGEKITEFQRLVEAGKGVRAELDALNELEAQQKTLREPAGTPVARRGMSMPMSMGKLVTATETYKLAQKQRTGRMDRVFVPDALKALHAGTVPARYVVPDRYDTVMLNEQQPSIVDLVTMLDTESDSIEYVREVSTTGAPVPAAEYTESAAALTITLELVNEPVKSIPAYVGVGLHVLADEPRTRGIIDNKLIPKARIALEDQMINGDGTGQNYTGILNTVGVQTRTQAAVVARGLATDTKADAIRRCLTDVQLAFYDPDAILMHPGDAESIELEKGDDSHYVNIYDRATNSIWRVAIKASPVIALGTALIGAFAAGATLYDRNMTEIYVGQPNAQFLQRAASIMIDMRAAFTVDVPVAFSVLTFA